MYKFPSVASATLNKRSPIPAYNQLIDIIYSQIKNRIVHPHDMLPSETELCKVYGVSRITVREALKKLTQDGLLYSIKGKGTFVAEPKLDLMIKIPDFFEDMTERGLKPEVKILDVRRIKASKLVSEKLMVSLNEDVFCIKRLFFADKKPYVLEKKFIVCTDCKILNSHVYEDPTSIESQAVFDVLAGKCHVCNEYADVTIEVTTVRSDESKYLQVPAGSLAFYVDLVAYKKDNTPCGWIASVMRGDLYRFKTRVSNFPITK